MATVADEQTGENQKLLASRIRQIGVRRVLYGSDAAFGGRLQICFEPPET